MKPWKPTSIIALPGPLEGKFGNAYRGREESPGVMVNLGGGGYSVTVHVLSGDDGLHVGRVEIDGDDLSARDIQRLPLASALRAAIAAARVFSEQQDARGEVLPFYGTEKLESGWAGAANRVLLPRGGPPTRRPAGFYKQIAAAYNDLVLKGKSPVKEIARRKDVDENTVHQWIHKARKLKFLDPSPRSRKK